MTCLSSKKKKLIKIEKYVTMSAKTEKLLLASFIMIFCEIFRSELLCISFDLRPQATNNSNWMVKQGKNPVATIIPSHSGINSDFRSDPLISKIKNHSRLRIYIFCTCVFRQQTICREKEMLRLYDSIA